MANDLLYLLLRTSISASLNHREAFIEKVAKIIEQKTCQNPKDARRIGNYIADLLEKLNDALLLRQLTCPDKRFDQALAQLTAAINKLNTLLEDRPLESCPSNTHQA